MIIDDANSVEKYEICVGFKYVWGPLGYVLASSLLFNKISRAFIDQQFFD